MITRKYLLTTITALLIGNTAWADAWYVRGDFAYSWIWDQTADATFDLTQTPVPLGQLGVGYVLEPYVRFDVTGSLTGGRNITLDCAKTASTCSSSKSGYTTIDTTTLFANVYYEMASIWAQEPTRWHPYIGLGLGSAYQSMNSVHATLDTGSGPFSIDVDGHGQWQFAWRTMAGLAVTLTDNLLLDMAYVYMGAGQAESGTTSTPATPSLQKPLTMDMNAQEVYVGLRQQF